MRVLRRSCPYLRRSRVRYRHVSREKLVKHVAHEEQLRFCANGLRNLLTVRVQLDSSASGTRLRVVEAGRVAYRWG
jgi:hypothetical protein